jgi:hypothetical protein
VLNILFPDSLKWISEDALAMGTLCHEEMAKVLLSRIHCSKYQPHADPTVAKRIAAALEYLDKRFFETVAIESPILYLGIGMTPDHVCLEVLPDGLNKIKHLHDWKFAESITDQYFFQAELYARAENVAKATIIQINREGQVYPHRVKPEEERWELIKSAINIRHHIDRKEKRHV